MTQRLPVILVHGVRLSGSMWEPTATLLRLGREVTCLDLPGHGVRRGEPFTIDGALEAVREAIDEVGGTALVAGMSLGGYVSMAAAARFGAARVAGLVALGCTANPQSRLRSAYTGMSWVQSRTPWIYKRMNAILLKRIIPAEAFGAFAAGGFADEVFADAIDAVANLDPIGDVAAYDGPTWFINGGRDQMRLNEKQFYAASAHGRLSVWPGLNHLSVMTDPRRLARQIDDACAVVEMARATGDADR